MFPSNTGSKRPQAHGQKMNPARFLADPAVQMSFASPSAAAAYRKKVARITQTATRAVPTR
jgi:hypothetical protein